MAEVLTVSDLRRAQAIVRLLEARGVQDVGLWPQDMLDTSIGILGGGPLFQPPYRFHAKGPAGPFLITVSEDLAPLARRYLESPAAEAEIARLVAADDAPAS